MFFNTSSRWPSDPLAKETRPAPGQYELPSSFSAAAAKQTGATSPRALSAISPRTFAPCSPSNGGALSPTRRSLPQSTGRDSWVLGAVSKDGSLCMMNYDVLNTPAVGQYGGPVVPASPKLSPKAKSVEAAQSSFASSRGYSFPKSPASSHPVKIEVNEKDLIPPVGFYSPRNDRSVLLLKPSFRKEAPSPRSAPSSPKGNTPSSHAARSSESSRSGWLSSMVNNDLVYKKDSTAASVGPGAYSPSTLETTLTKKSFNARAAASASPRSGSARGPAAASPRSPTSAR